MGLQDDLSPADSTDSKSKSFHLSSITERHLLPKESFNVPHSICSVSMRHRAWWWLLSMIVAGVVFAKLIWNFTPKMPDTALKRAHHEESAENGTDWNRDRISLAENVRVVALASYIGRSRTSILDCFLQSNLAINGGLLDQVIFVPETGQEMDLDWLHALVQSTPGYYLLGKQKQEGSVDPGVMLAQEASTANIPEQDIGTGPFARAWNLALLTSQLQAAPLHVRSDEEPTLDSTTSTPFNTTTIYIFIHGETIFLAHEAVSQLLRSHFSHPSYTFIHANVINQPVQSWIHHHLSVVRPYRPETKLPVRSHRKKPLAKKGPNKESDIAYPWRASELPLWQDNTDAKTGSLENMQPSSEPAPVSLKNSQSTDIPSLFGIPIDFHSPFRGHRWLPYHPHRHQPLADTEIEAENTLNSAETKDDDRTAESIATPVTQAMMTLQRPGKWPWTLSALHLYSFLEHMECTTATTSLTSKVTEKDKVTNRSSEYQPNCAAIGGLGRYNMGLWEYQSERYGMSIFAIDAATIRQIGPMPNGISEQEVLDRVARTTTTVSGGAVIEGSAIAVRFVGSSGAAEAASEMKGLESTDLLRRFESLAREVGGCDAAGVFLR